MNQNWSELFYSGIIEDNSTNIEQLSITNNEISKQVASILSENLIELEELGELERKEKLKNNFNLEELYITNILLDLRDRLEDKTQIIRIHNKNNSFPCKLNKKCKETLEFNMELLLVMKKLLSLDQFKGNEIEISTNEFVENANLLIKMGKVILNDTENLLEELQLSEISKSLKCDLVL